jgi:hypothetical protein
MPTSSWNPFTPVTAALAGELGDDQFLRACAHAIAGLAKARRANPLLTYAVNRSSQAEGRA